MRVETAVPWKRRFPRFVALLAAVTALACTDSSEPSAPRPTAPAVGWLSGAVTLLGDDGPTHPAGSITLYASREDLESWTPRYAGALHRRDGAARVYDFIIGGIVPGDYFVVACWPSVACGEYRDDAGALRRVRILPARITRLKFGL